MAGDYPIRYLCSCLGACLCSRKFDYVYQEPIADMLTRFRAKLKYPSIEEFEQANDKKHWNLYDGLD